MICEHPACRKKISPNPKTRTTKQCPTWGMCSPLRDDEIVDTDVPFRSASPFATECPYCGERVFGSDQSDSYQDHKWDCPSSPRNRKKESKEKAAIKRRRSSKRRKYTKKRKSKKHKSPKRRKRSKRSKRR